MSDVRYSMVHGSDSGYLFILLYFICDPSEIRCILLVCEYIYS
jgi:hypothetical protein